VNAPHWWSGVAANRLVASRSGSVGRLAIAAWPLFQATLAASAAWLIALRVAGHADPFFAPIAALVALNAPRGERGLQAVRLLLGVVLGIGVGEGTAALLGAGFGRLGLAAFVAMMIAHAAGGARIVVVQAGAGAILTVIAADGDAGVNRLIDALIGGGVALLFSQVLFSPEPVAMLRRAETAALVGIARGLDATARALEKGDAALAEQALMTLRDVRDRLGELARLRDASRNVARRSAIWRSQRDPLVRERENADHLDLLGGACVMLARAVIASDLSERERLAGGIRELADSLAALARAPADRDPRQRAADRSLEVARSLASSDPPPGSSAAFANSMLRIVATDVMVFAGIDPAAAAEAVQKGSADFEVPPPPSMPRAPFGLDRWRGRRSGPRSAAELPRRQSDPPDGDPEE
jgi:uncharacterized membrane protein YgaE (UPF0421/DUF939 family)